MYTTSSQLKYWTFPVTELEKLREEASQRYVENHSKNFQMDDTSRFRFFLTVEEESKIRRFYEYELKNFCLAFQPPMPNYVLGTAMCYFKRFFLHTSVMDHHPRNVLYSCIYLACKVEEFNIPIEMFVKNISSVKKAAAQDVKYEADKAGDILLSEELLLLEILHFHLTVHNPYRPVEGLFIDIKTRCPEISDLEKLRKGVEAFLINCLHTDACLLFSPSQIALAALVSSGANSGINLDSYVANKLVDSKENLRKIVDHIQRLRQMVKQVEQFHGQYERLESEVKMLEVKLEQCRNQENNPDSVHYRRTNEEFSDEEDDSQSGQKKFHGYQDLPMDHDILM